MITLTEEQAQQIDEIVEHLLVDHPTARHHKACVEALSIIRTARAQGECATLDAHWVSEEELPSFNAWLNLFVESRIMEDRAARAQEQAEQEPVGYFAYDEEHDIWEELVSSSVAGGVPLYREPVQQVDLYEIGFNAGFKDGVINERSKQVDLTDALKHYADTYCEGWCKETGGTFEDCGGCKARAVIAAYKEKNK